MYVCMNIYVVQETTPICRSCLVCAYPFRISSTLGIKANNLQSPDTATDKWKSYLCVPDHSRVCLSYFRKTYIRTSRRHTTGASFQEPHFTNILQVYKSLFRISIKYYSVYVCIQKLLLVHANACLRDIFSLVYT